MSKEIQKVLLDVSCMRLVLIVLKRGNNQGYQIGKTIKGIFDGKIIWKEASLHRLLLKMVSLKYIESYWEINPGFLNRKFYSISKLGEEMLDKLNDDWNLVNNIFEELAPAENN